MVLEGQEGMEGLGGSWRVRRVWKILGWFERVLEGLGGFGGSERVQ